MAKVEGTSNTILSTGNKLLILNDATLDINRVSISVIDSDTVYSLGGSDGVTTYCSNKNYGDISTTTFFHYRNISGVKTKVIELTVTSFDVGEFWINVSTLAQSTQLKCTVYGN